MEKRLISGCKAVAEGVKLARVKVIAAYPITPQTEIIEYLARMIADNELDADMIIPESEHSAISICMGASLTGVRTFTATCSQGLALMHECLFQASGLRLPIVMAITNRALSHPGSILGDHSDTMASRDSGWIQFWAKNCQEVLDSILIAYKVAEIASLPTMVNLDGFTLSHLYEPVELPEPIEVEDFLPAEPKKRGPLLSQEFSGFIGPPSPAEYTEEWHYMLHKSLIESKSLIQKVDAEFAQRFGRKYSLVEEYQCDDAEIILVGMGSVVGTIEDSIETLRKEGIRVGLIRLRVFRPFPLEDVRKILRRASVVAVLDRSISHGSTGGPVFHEVSSALNIFSDKPIVIGFVLGLGGRDITKELIIKIIKFSESVKKSGIIPSESIFPSIRENILKKWEVTSIV
jgi:pyruvate ferredoxin oxidoreductase alpha subunit